MKTAKELEAVHEIFSLKYSAFLYFQDLLEYIKSAKIAPNPRLIILKLQKMIIAKPITILYKRYFQKKKKKKRLLNLKVFI